MEVGPTLEQLFNDNTMITLATGLVQHFFTHWHIHDDQTALSISTKTSMIIFLDEIISKDNILFWSLTDGLKPITHSYTYTQGPKVVLLGIGLQLKLSSSVTK